MDSPKAGSERSEGFEVLEPQAEGSTCETCEVPPSASKAAPPTPEKSSGLVAPAPSPAQGGAASLGAGPAKPTPAGQAAAGTQPGAAPPVLVLVNRSELEVQSKLLAVANLLLAACLILNDAVLLRAGAMAAVVCVLAGLQPQRTLRWCNAAAQQGRRAVALFMKLSAWCMATVTSGVRRAWAATTALGARAWAATTALGATAWAATTAIGATAGAACRSDLPVPFLGGMVVGAILNMAVLALWPRTSFPAVTFCTDALFGREFWSTSSENVHGPLWRACAWSFLLLASPMAVWLTGRQMVPPRFEGE